MKKTTILMYHSIGKAVRGHETGTELYSVSEENFHDQMQYIAKTLRDSPLGNLRNSFGGDRPYKYGDSHCLITFDDGFLNNYRIAFPVLREFELKAYFFITINRIGCPGYMNWEKIRELHSAGMTIGSHGMTHAILDGQSEEDLDYEIKWSKKILEEKLGAAVDYFSVPRGFHNKRVIAKAKEAGYEEVFTSDIDKSDGYKFGRIAVKADWDLEYFKQVVDKGLPLKDRTSEFIKNTSKKMLGAKNYDRIRSKILKGQSKNGVRIIF